MHKIEKEKKKEYFGEGEWVEEPDELKFNHMGIDCSLRRIIAFELSGHAFGGHLCGYCKVPKNHPWVGASFDLDVDVHGGITFGRTDENEDYWLGFDCAHSGDLVPSLNRLFDRSFSKGDTYKTVPFCIEECKKLADQINKASQ